MAKFSRKDARRIADAVRAYESSATDLTNSDTLRRKRKTPSETFGVKVTKDGGSQASVSGFGTSASWTYECKSPSGNFTYDTGCTPVITALQLRRPKIQITYAPDNSWGIACRDDAGMFVLLIVGESEQLDEPCETEGGGE